jgi:hypothetical protein
MRHPDQGFSACPYIDHPISFSHLVLVTHIILNEMQTKGDERVELYNPTADSVDISG